MVKYRWDIEIMRVNKVMGKLYNQVVDEQKRVALQFFFVIA